MPISIRGALLSGASNSRGLEPEGSRGHLYKLVAPQNRDGTSLQADQSLFGPDAQLFIRTLARSPNDLADLALGDRDFGCRFGCLRLVGQSQQCFCEVGWQIEERQFLHLLAGAAQARAKYLDDLHHQIGVAAQKWNEISTLDHHEHAVGHRRGIGSARASVKQRDLSEDFTLVNNVEHDVVALCRGHADLHGTGEHAHQADARIALGKDHGPTRQAPPLHVRAEMLKCYLWELAKKRMPAQKSELVFRVQRI
jgi:hypothetical protein